MVIVAIEAALQRFAIHRRLGRGEAVTGRLRSMGENLRRLEAVTAEDVQELAVWLAGQDRARVLVGPAA